MDHTIFPCSGATLYEDSSNHASHRSSNRCALKIDHGLKACINAHLKPMKNSHVLMFISEPTNG